MKTKTNGDTVGDATVGYHPKIMPKMVMRDPLGPGRSSLFSSIQTELPITGDGKKVTLMTMDCR